MAQTIALQNHFVQFVPLDGTFFFSLGPDARLGAGAVTVTAQHDGVATTVPIFVEVIQMATRFENPSGGQRRSLDIIVRNNGHAGGAAGPITQFTAFTAIVTP
jgi:hypothetical protein